MKKSDPIEEKVEKYEEKILKEEDEIVALEKKIESEEGRILSYESRIFNLLGGLRFLFKGFGKWEAQFFRTGFARRFSKHKLLYSLTILTSVVLIWRGIWALADATPGVSNPLISIAVGVFFIWFIDSISELI